MTPASPLDESPGSDETRASSAFEASDPPGAGTDVGDLDARADAGLRAPDELPLAGRKALVTLLTHRFVSRAKQGEAWAGLLAYEPEIRARLDEMFLVLTVDHEYEVAFKRQSGRDDVPVLLRREKPLSRDASLLMVFLRREHAYSDARDEAVVVSRDQVAEFLSRYHDDAGQDEIRSMRRVDAAIAAMVHRDLLEPEPDDPSLFVVAPAIVPLITVEQLAHVERVFLEAAGAEAPADEPDASIDGAAEPDALDDDAGDEPGHADDGADSDSGDPDDTAEPDPTAVALDLPLDPEADQA
ncbi:DUF4194 domain-containing protein [Frigoribacterium faeni]|uniref:DUF4194 domain-containing protein n=1 Tax=Frigoribacterium faeni TaxID=145483 RepID=A0A7W3JHR3_9MICO|nr:DUF4194 domain-containing protein [Frigoribacterium faeni]MBA8813110.1 hypothetical protein [Frigoribacterium faeni]BFF14293.1 hypothetical protein GCM10025699_55960 [Microbacterium flavescens]GEK83414.1 hypothetical protein FFA01_17230 [Frigoribacterium faeni]